MHIDGRGAHDDPQWTGNRHQHRTRPGREHLQGCNKIATQQKNCYACGKGGIAVMSLIFFVAASLATASAPATPPAPVESATNPAAAQAPSATEEDYTLGVDDKVRIIVFNEETLSGEFIVSSNGMLSLPMIGDVPASGRRTRDVIKDVQARLADGYLKDPRVSMDVLTFRPYYILGEVGKAGEYPYSNGMTVLNAVAQAEGFTYRANRSKVFIKHNGSSIEAREDLTPGLRVSPGDTIRIGERYF
jgi:polysaccharide biosynthesis/export protein